MKNEVEVIVGAQAIADYLGVSRTTFIAHRDAQHIPYYRIGAKVMARRERLDEWIENGGGARYEDLDGHPDHAA